ncbi:hypothetical protein JO379_004595 [Streptomyces syringium]|uniref:Uncharacterized protein n=1 Tax=Streptomyces syringium TaxID=76729 RepID=A0ABS4Y8U9_9ACTN|nr:hypothetical protein [Streptomyces syringium]
MCSHRARDRAANSVERLNLLVADAARASRFPQCKDVG